MMDSKQTENNQTEKLVLSVQESADLIGLSKSKMYDITHRADFNALVRIGTRKLILRHKLLEWLENQAEAGNVA